MAAPTYGIYIAHSHAKVDMAAAHLEFALLYIILLWYNVFLLVYFDHCRFDIVDNYHISLRLPVANHLFSPLQSNTYVMLWGYGCFFGVVVFKYFIYSHSELFHIFLLHIPMEFALVWCLAWISKLQQIEGISMPQIILFIQSNPFYQ